MPEHGDGISALHHFPGGSADPTAMVLDIHFVLV
jgi:hypothetical protein